VVELQARHLINQRTAVGLVKFYQIYFSRVAVQVAAVERIITVRHCPVETAAMLVLVQAAAAAVRELSLCQIQE
jgi:hypothetical protein